MKTLQTIILLILILIPQSANANSYENSKTHALGFAAGSTYGIGLSYSYDWEHNGIQFTALPVWDQEEGGLVAGGINLKKNFHHNNMVGIYGSFGIAGMMMRDVWEDCEWDEENNEEVNCVTEIEESRNYAVGPGVGMEFSFWGNMIFRFELPLAVRNGTDGFGISPIPNAAIMYRWDAPPKVLQF